MSEFEINLRWGHKDLEVISTHTHTLALAMKCPTALSALFANIELCYLPALTSHEFGDAYSLLQSLQFPLLPNFL